LGSWVVLRRPLGDDFWVTTALAGPAVSKGTAWRAMSSAHIRLPAAEQVNKKIESVTAITSGRERRWHLLMARAIGIRLRDANSVDSGEEDAMSTRMFASTREAARVFAPTFTRVKRCHEKIV
jgi:hypothetical protein